MKGCVFALLLTALIAPSAAAQAPTGCLLRTSTTADTARADVAILARVQARVLRFNSDPQASLRFSGCPVADTSRVVVRTNLPTPVRAGTVYQNVVVDFRAKLRLSDIDCIVATALAHAVADSASVVRARQCPTQGREQ